MKGIILKSNVITSATTVLTDYCGNMIYEGGALKQILVDGGYVTFSGSTPTYHYYLQDHLGNNRVVCNASSTVEQVNHYYPFGGLFGESTNGDTQRYKYNGKELDRMHGLDWYDYGAWVPGNYDTGIIEIPKYEQFACFIENLIRMEHGVSLRSHYGVTTSGKPFEPSRIIDKEGNLFNFRPFSY